MVPEIMYVVAGVAVAVFAWRHIRSHRAYEASKTPRSPGLQVALHLGYHLAKVNQQRLVDAATLTCALLQDEELAELLGSCGWDAEALDDALMARLSADDGSKTRLQAGWALSRAAEDALLRAEHRADREEIGCCDLFAELLVGEGHGEEEALIAPMLEEAGVDGAELLFALVHRTPDARLVVAEDGAAPTHEVLIFNDEFTTMEFVVSVLRDTFELEEEQAMALMLRVHQEGQASCGRWPGEQALELANDARARAREQGFPLRLALG